MNVGVDNSKCQGHAQCDALSEFFTLDDDGYSNIGPAKEVPAGLEDEARQGIEACPESALAEVSDDAG